MRAALPLLFALPLVACTAEAPPDDHAGHDHAEGESHDDEGEHAEVADHDEDGDSDGNEVHEGDADGAHEGDEDGEHDDAGGDGEMQTGQDAIDALRAHVTELSGKAEHDAQAVTVQHLLVSFRGTGTRATRSKEEAEQLAADLWQQIQSGDFDYDQMIRDHTDDSAPGIYKMVSSPPPPAGAYVRTGMVPAFGNVGWRLEVGEFGVAGHSADSPYGWHIVKRTE